MAKRGLGVYGVLLGAVVALSFGSILVKLTPAPAPTIAAYRLALATLLLAPLAWRGRAELRRLSRAGVRPLRRERALPGIALPHLDQLAEIHLGR
jgi:drug/metabolite transporter (DMT)-like permease